MDVLLLALTELFEPLRFAMVVLGVVVGLVIGVIPGLGGVFGLTILVPVTYALDPYAAVALLLAMGSVTTISDTIPAILLGIPGTVGAAASCLDGHELAKQRQAARAFGATYVSQLAGGIFGALVLAAALPVMRPLVTALNFGDFLAITIFGLTLVAMLSGSDPIKGVVAALFGALVSYVGLDPNEGAERWTFGQVYLWDGLPTEVVFLGLFGLSELASLMARGQIQYRPEPPEPGGMVRGMRDAVANWRLILRSSALGSLFGAIPGVGLSVIDWIAYGDAARRTRGGVPFGQGNIRAVIAPESASNAKEGGALIPTLAFGIPGSATMAILLGAFTIHGITPGPDMLDRHMPLLVVMILTIALANVIGTLICLALTGQLARLARTPAPILVPLAMVIVTVGAFQSGKSAMDLGVLLVFGAFGIAMKRLGWARPAFVLGFVLGPNLERFFFLSYQISGWGWLAQPVVIVILALAAAALLRQFKARQLALVPQEPGSTTGAPLWQDAALILLIGGLAAGAAISAGALPPAAALFPRLVALAAVALSALLMVRHLRARASRGRPGPAGFAPDLRFLAGVAGLCLAILALGHLAGPAVFLIAAALWFGRPGWRGTALSVAGVLGAIWVVFDLAVSQPWPRPWLWSVLGLG